MIDCDCCVHRQLTDVDYYYVLLLLLLLLLVLSRRVLCCCTENSYVCQYSRNFGLFLVSVIGPFSLSHIHRPIRVIDKEVKWQYDTWYFTESKTYITEARLCRNLNWHDYKYWNIIAWWDPKHCQFIRMWLSGIAQSVHGPTSSLS